MNVSRAAINRLILFQLLLASVLALPAGAAPIVSYNLPADTERDEALTRALNLELSYRLEAFPGFPLTDELPPSALDEIPIRKIWQNADASALEAAFATVKSSWFLIGRHTQTGGEIRSTIKIFHRGEKIGQDTFSAAIKSADFQTFQKQLVARFFNKMEGREPHNPEIRFPPPPSRSEFEAFARAAALLDAGKVNSGLKELETALTARPNYRDALYLYGKTALLQTFEYDRALEKFRRIVKTDPADAAAWFWIGFTCYLKGDAEAAIQAFEHAKKHKADIGIFSYLATIYEETRRYDSAIENYTRALEIEPRNAALWYQLATLHARLNRRAEALRALRRALDLDAESFFPVARADSDFARWKRDPEFESLLKEFKK